jgi:lipoprotein-anchoring transpeptidase ErfK/SrfK
MSTSRTRLAIVAVVVVALLGGGLLWVLRSSDPESIAAPEPIGTVGSSAPGTTVPTTAAPYHSVVATATVPELEVFAAKPADPADPASSVPAPETTVAAPTNVQPIPRVGLSSAGSRKTATGWAFANPTTFGSPLVMAVNEVAGDWVRVEIPARPNSQEGWIRAADVTLSESEYRMELTLSEFTLRVFQGDTLVVETQVVIGTDYTKTPIGTFYLGEVLSSQQAGVGGPNGTYGPFILATSAYSESLDLFDGGLPVIAFHGTNSPGLIGSKASNGCIRMANEVVTQLAEMVPAGSLITIKE